MIRLIKIVFIEERCQSDVEGVFYKEKPRVTSGKEVLSSFQ